LHLVFSNHANSSIYCIYTYSVYIYTLYTLYIYKLCVYINCVYIKCVYIFTHTQNHHKEIVRRKEPTPYSPFPRR